MGTRVQTQMNTAPAPSLILVRAGILQRKCACSQHTGSSDECAECRQKREGPLQRAAVNTTPVNAVPPVVHDALSSRGQPLDDATRAFMEPRFGHDFSSVRVHTDAQAAESARSVNALAYTTGQHIAFDQGQYRPEKQAGKQLLAHELSHVVQQGATDTHGSVPNNLLIGKASDPLEQSAHQVAAGITNPQALKSGPLSGLTAPTIQRQQAPGVPDVQLTPPALTKEQGLASFTIADFALGGTKLTDEQKHTLDEAVEQIRSLLAAHPDAYISIVGHTDTTGSDERNAVVGQGRAKTVLEYFVSKKMPQHLMYASNKGPNEPAIKTDKNVAEPRNRRVEITVKQQQKAASSQQSKVPSDAPVIPQIVKPQRPDLTYHPKYHEETPDERFKRVNDEIEKALKVPRKPGESLQDHLNHAVDSLVNPLMERLHVPKEYREKIRNAAHNAVEKGIESLIDTAMDQTNLDNTQKEAIRNTVKGVLQYKSQNQEGQKQ